MCPDPIALVLIGRIAANVGAPTEDILRADSEHVGPEDEYDRASDDERTVHDDSRMPVRTLPLSARLH